MAGVATRVAPVRAADNVAPFVTRLTLDSLLPRYRPAIPVDPLASNRSAPEDLAVAPDAAIPTLPSAPAGGRSLTAILIADERRIAVIDDVTVKVGDVLRDGSRIASIQPDRVWVVESNGRWRMLTLTTRGQ
jgi:hypothetical protein